VELGSDVAFIAGLIGEPVRAAMLIALLGGRALPAGELAFISNVAPQTASFHLRKLLEASLIAVDKRGKHSYYRLADERVAAALESVAALAPVRNQVDLRSRTRVESERVKELRFARSCYRHLAGQLAVQLNQALIDRTFLVRDSEVTYRLTDLGTAWCRQLGVNIHSSARACLDWTERRPHIGGPLGTALFSRLSELSWIVKNPNSRAVRVTHLGVRELEQQLGITVAAVRQ